MQRTIGWVPVAGLLFALSVPAAGAEWAELRGSFTKSFEDADRNEDVRAALVKDLAAAAPSDEKSRAELAQLVVTALTVEIGQRKEDAISGQVLSACEEALRVCTGKRAVEFLAKMAKSSSLWRVRFHLLRSFNRSDDEEILKLLEDLGDDKEPRIQIAALDALGTRKNSARHAALFLTVARNDKITWASRVSAIRALGGTGDKAQIQPLIDLLRTLGKSDGRLKEETAAALRLLTGQEGGVEAAGWEALLAQKKPVASGGGGQVVMTGAAPARFYGITTASTKIFFMIDISGSMQEPASEPASTGEKEKDPTYSGSGPGGKVTPVDDNLVKRKKQLVDDRKVNVRIDSAKKELIRSIYNLSSGVMFNVATFGVNAKPWMPQLVPATPQNKLAAFEFVERIDAHDGTTNVWEALELGLGLGDHKQNYATALGGADTFFLLTDGAPTSGKFTSAKEIFEELEKVNALKKVKIHCICLGDAEKAKRYKPDPKFLEELAAKAGGKFIHVKEK